MKNRVLNLLLLLCLGDAVHYFIAGEYYRNSDFRNFAVATEILLIAGFFIYQWRQNKVDSKMS